ncbi:hypothetical protein GT037_008900 [Alternaria burnsii]|uniref:AAA+ ATPase domain-containing protein n=1 Tax=Alternaria burnsii TaxID=1187904 RepID=A0A8H7B119_9PLEO|nr:uncharacterized protein GT037_008900 [Alternaria burnsii]KAF7672949.1 hypothetical protein GT037_008900 [Alternaria burnsii]
MSDYSSHDDDRRVDSWRQTKGRIAKRQSNFLETVLDTSIASSMEKPLFKVIRMWIDSNTGLDLKFLVWAIALCVPTHKYGSATCKWLSSNLTNSVELDHQDALVTDLLIWINKLETIDMDPRKKQELLTDLQVFLGEGTEDYYWQNGTLYRRGYMFYGPAGTCKTNLSTAIASHYNFPLCVIDLAGMDDTVLQDKVKNLPPRCVSFSENIDAAGIVRERTMVPKTDVGDEGDETSSESESTDTWDTEPSKVKVKKADPKKMNTSLSQPSRTEVTLSGLFNTLDGPGSREGHIVIVTTNAPDSLNEALHRPGLIDTQVYLGFADRIIAGITFTRIFGSDKQVKESQKAVGKLGREFGRLLPSDFFTPAEIQKFCMNRRGRPQKAVDEFPGYIDEKRTGKTKFQYDIHRRAPKPTFHKEGVIHDDDSSDEVEYSPRNTRDSSEGAHNAFPAFSRISSTETSVKRPAKEQLFVAHGHEHDDDALAKQVTGLGDSSTEHGKSQHMSLSGTYCEPYGIEPCVLCKPGIRPRRLSREHHNLRPNDIEETHLPNLNSCTGVQPSLPQSRSGATSLDESRSTLPSSTELTEASSYYTPLSVGEQIERTFKRHRRPSRPDVAGCCNIYPYHGPLPRTAEEDFWVDEASPKSATVLLHNVDPQPLEDFEKLRLAGRDDDAVDQGRTVASSAVAGRGHVATYRQGRKLGLTTRRYIARLKSQIIAYLQNCRRNMGNNAR